MVAARHKIKLGDERKIIFNSEDPEEGKDKTGKEKKAVFFVNFKGLRVGKN